MHRTLLKTSSGFSNAHPTLSGWNQSRTVTDIPWYVYPDSTHMHFVDSRSPKRKFLIKLEKQAEASEKRRNVKPQRLNPSQLKPIELPTFIERGPTDVLRAMTLTLKKDYNAPDYKFHDDPYLTPYRAADKRAFVEAKEGGKVAARYVLRKHKDLFEKNLIEMVPHVKAFTAAGVTGFEVTKKKAGPRELKLCIDSCNVAGALKVYKFMEEKAAHKDEKLLKDGKEENKSRVFCSPKQKQDFLELLCFHNSSEDEVMDEDYNFRREGMSGRDRNKLRKDTWNKDGPADRIAEEIIANSPTEEAGHKARLALMIGKAKFNDFKGVDTLYQDIRNFAGFLNLEGFNAKLKSIAFSTDPYDVKKKEQKWKDIQDLLKLMNKEKIYPDRNTLNMILIFFRRMAEIDLKKLQDVGQLDIPNIKKSVLSTLAEFKKLGIEPSLRGYADLSHILGKFPNPEILSRLEEIQKSKGTLINEVENEECLYFFKEVMMQAKRCSSIETATKIHQLVLNDPNSDVLLGGPTPQNEYYMGFMEVNLANKSLNEFIKIFHTYVPHSFNPYINTYEKILDSVIENGQPEHIPGLWVNYDADHPNLGWPMLAPHMRTQNAKILLKFCEAIDLSNPFSAKAKENNDVSNSSEIDKHQLSKSLGNVISRIFDEFHDLYSSRAEIPNNDVSGEIPEWKKNKTLTDEDDPEQYDNQICQTLVKISLDLGQYGLAQKVVEFCYENFGDLQKQKKHDVKKTDSSVIVDITEKTTADVNLSLNTDWATILEYFTEVMIEENKRDHALNCVIFMDKQGHNVTKLAIQVGQKLKLNKKQKEMLNINFGRHSSWMMLEV